MSSGSTSKYPLATVQKCILLSFLLLNLIGLARADNSDPADNLRPSQDSNFQWNKLPPPEQVTEHGQLYPHRPAEPLTPGEFEESNLLNSAELQRPRPISLSILENADRVKKQDTKNGLTDKERRWPMGIIPYVISEQFDHKWRVLIARSFKEFHKYTCIRFVPRKAQKDYVYLVQGEGCDSDAGREGGEQTVSLGPDCNYLSTIVHELNHAVGFWHEQNRYDRDSFIKIHWDNIFPENKFNFDKLKNTEITDFGVPYDTNSLMHYDQYAFSKEPGKLPVMTPFEDNPNMGLGNRFSKSDVEKINRMYDCKYMKPWLEKSPTFSSRVDDTMQCYDFHSNCTDMATENSGCASTWMTVNCRKSCNVCDLLCQDTNRECAEWATSGKCATDADYMYLYCPKSCNSKCHDR